MTHLDNYAGREPNPQITEVLLRRWGRVAAGWPVYRLVHSESVMEKIGGRWHIWDGNLNIQDRGGIVGDGMGNPTQSHFHPDRVFVGLIDAQVYSDLDQHGWILERYYPPEYFGSPQWWANQTVPGTRIPLLGPYPSEGRYLKMVGPMPKEPPVSFLEDFISEWENRRANFPTDIEAYIKMRVQEAVDREGAKSDLAIRTNTDRIADSASPLTSTTLEAGRWRNKTFEKSGHTSHIGN